MKTAAALAILGAYGRFADAKHRRMAPPVGDEVCKSIMPSVSDEWCDTNCNHSPPNCPATYCECSGGTPTPAPAPGTPTPAPPAPTPAPETPTPAPAAPTPSPTTPTPPVAQGQRVIGYHSSWDHYTNGYFDWTPEVANMLTHVNYAFGTVSYSTDQDMWYVSPADPWADMGDCAGSANCYGQDPDCIEIPHEATCGSASDPTVTLVPYIGADTGSSSCPTECFNAGGATTGRSPQCIASLATFTHPKQQAGNWSAPTRPSACGLYNRDIRVAGAKYPHLKWILSVGGWYDSSYFSAATSDKHRAAFVKSAVRYIVAFGFDGIDIDWEYPGFEHGGEPMPGMPKVGDPEEVTDCAKETCQYDGRNTDGIQYAKFVAELREAFKAEGKNKHGEDYTISIAAPADTVKVAKMDVAAMCKSLDWVNVMTYDMAGQWDAATGHQAPVSGCDNDECFSTEKAMQAYLDEGCSPDQLHVGVPFYAHQFDNVKGTAPDPSLPGLKVPFTGPSQSTCQTSPGECVPTWRAGGASWAKYAHWDEAAVASYAYDTATDTFFSYDNPQAISAKIAYAKKKGFGGLMYWFIQADDTSSTLLKAIHNGL